MGFLLRMEALFFEILFVMTEVVGKPSSWALQKTMFLFWIDLGQVLRVMTMPAYGWSEGTYNTFKHIDLVYVFANLVSSVIPRYSLFVFGSFLVLLALADTAYALKVFKRAAKVQTMWPIKLLRMLVATVVTILFSSVLKWLLIPIECEVSSERSLSSYLHGEDAPCTPWIFPEYLFSVFTIAISITYILFALVVSLLSFEINPLARGVRSQCTGRVEVLWIVSKVAVTFVAYLARWVQPVTCGVVFLLMMLFVLYRHLQLMPFHRHETNVIRGGVFTCCCWLAVATTIVAAAENSLASSEEWWLLGFTPVFFLVGAGGTHYLHVRISRSIERLRAEFTYQKQLREEKSKQDSWQRGSSFREAKTGNTPAWEKFYDPTWESRKAFKSEDKARVVLRTLLYRRDKSDVPFLIHLMQRALEEYPDSVNLRIFELLLVRFVKQDQMEAQSLERRYKLDQKSLPIDYRYIFFALERKAVKDSAGASLGKETFSVINVMEFDAGMERAKKAHMQCIIALRKFWSVTSLLGRKDREEVMIGEMLNHFKTLDIVIDSANQEYMALVELYPSSVTLLQTYAHFCDTILSNEKEADKWRSKADALEDFDHDDSSLAEKGMGSAGGGEDHHKKNAGAEKFKLEDGRSETSGVSSMRSLTNKSLTSWRETVLNEEQRSVARLHSRVKMVVFLLLMVASAGYGVMNHYLLSDLAFQNINSIDSTLYFAHHTVLTCYLLRDQQIASLRNETSRVEHDRQIVSDYMKELKTTHRSNFESLTSQGLRDFYINHPLIVHEPAMSGWVRTAHHFWYQLNDFARRVLRAVETTQDEFRDPVYRLAEISDEKRNVAFVFENTFPALMPAYEQLLSLYQEEVERFVSTARLLIAMTAIANTVFIIGITCFVLFTLRRVVPKMQSNRVSITMALRFPKKCRQKLKELYTELERLMLELADEDAARNALEANNDDCENVQSPTNVPLPIPMGNDLPTTDDNLIQPMAITSSLPDRMQRSVSVVSGSGVWEDDARMPKGLSRTMSTRSVALTASNLLEFTRMQEAGGEDLPPPAKWNVDNGNSFNRSLRSLLSQGQVSLQGRGEYSKREGASPRRARGEFSRMEGAPSKESAPSRADDAVQLPARLQRRRASLSSVRSWNTEEMAAATPKRTPSCSPNITPTSFHARILSGGPHQASVNANPWLGASPVLNPRPADSSEVPALGKWLPQLTRIDSESPRSLTHEVDKVNQGWSDDKDEDEDEDVMRLVIPHRPPRHLLDTVAEMSESGSPAPIVPRKRAMLRPESDMDLNIAEARTEPEEVVVDHWPEPDGEHRPAPADASLVAPMQVSETVFIGARPRGPGLVGFESDGTEAGAKEKESTGPAKKAEEQKPATMGLAAALEALEHEEDKVEDVESLESSPTPPGSNTEESEIVPEEDTPGSSPEFKPPPVQPQGTETSLADSQVRFGGVKDIDKPMRKSEESGDGHGKYSSPKSALRRSSDIERPNMAVANNHFKTSFAGLPDLQPGAPDPDAKTPSVEDEGMQPNDLSDELDGMLSGKVHAMRPWHSLGLTWAIATCTLIGICIFSIVYPMRILPDIADMAPMVDHGGRRAYLVQSCVFLARELIISDGFSRVKPDDNARQLEMLLDILQREHEAVRLGDDLGIAIGADLRFESHNQVMYEPGCPWREWNRQKNARRASSAADTSMFEDVDDECFLEGRGDAAANGLNHVMLTFFDSVRSVIFKFKPDSYVISPTTDVHGITRDGEMSGIGHGGESEDESVWAHHFSQDDFLVVNTSEAKLQDVDEDPDMKFLTHNLEGDLVMGLNMLQELFHDEAHKIIDTAHLENEIFFILYALCIICGWYFALFRSVVRSANHEATKAHNFIARLPLHVLTTKEITVLSSMFLEQDKDKEE